MITIKKEVNLADFEAWSGGWDTLKVLLDRHDCETVQECIEELTADLDEPWTDTQLNDFLWFDRDTIAEALGYESWEDYENGDKDDDGEEA